MDYSVQEANKYIGRRFIVGLRYIQPNERDIHSGLWGIAKSVHEDGILLHVEGGIEDKYWMMPPDLDAIQPAGASNYEFGDSGQIVENVDFEAHFKIAGNASHF
jgi:hypothetical protein